MQRLDYKKTAPEVFKAMWQLESAVHGMGLEQSLLELVKTRASQLNGCAFCIDMHTKDALAEGETAQRLFLLDAWREAPLYSPRERAALAWTEAVTLIHEDGASDAAYEEARQHFDEKELVRLTLAIVSINGWNRLSIAFRMPPTYERGAS
jgi:AhpD family alkylhydroperoxidase